MVVQNLKSNMLNSSTGKGFSKVAVTGENSQTNWPPDFGIDATSQESPAIPAIAPKNINGGQANA